MLFLAIAIRAEVMMERHLQNTGGERDDHVEANSRQ